MTYATLNVGLAVDGVVLQNQYAKTIRELFGITRDTAIDFRIANSATEPTAVIVVEEPLTEDQLRRLAVALRQDCVAQLTSEGVGSLVGPKPWGEFDLDQFITWEQALAAKPRSKYKVG